MDEKQQAALEGMRKAFEGAHGYGMPLDDSTFLRYLRARSFDLTKATKMLQATLQWRKDFNVEEIRQSHKETIVRENSTGKLFVRGFDKEGHVMIIMRPRNENTRDPDGNIKNLIYTMERAVACLEKTGQEKLCLLMDFEGYSIFNAPPMKVSRDTLSILQDHYPERLHRAYCIRPPTVFYAFYRLISPFIDPVTVQKIVMLTNADMSNVNNQLLRDVDADQLESGFGGSDARPFVSEAYLAGDFGDDFKTIADKLGL